MCIKLIGDDMKNQFIIFVSKLLISVLITLIILILIKQSSVFKTNFYKYTYGTNISFAKFNEFYNKYIGSNKIVDSLARTEPVFSEKMTYESVNKYLDGVVLNVKKNYLVPIEESGVVVFIGEKEGYNNTVIIQRIDGIDEWYGNMENVNVKLYDYVTAGSLLGDTNDKLFLVYKKDGNVLDWKEYLK